MSLLHLPKDFERWPEFIELQNRAGDSAYQLLLRLWVELAYEVETTGRVGLLRGASLSRLGRSLPDGWREALSALWTEEADGVQVARFARHHPHLDPAHVPMHMKGAAVSSWSRAMRKANAEVTQQSLLIPPEVWKKPDGTPMTHEEIRRVMLLVNGIDRALFRPERPANEQGYSEGLVLDAWRVLQTFHPNQVDMLCRRLIAKRNHPAVPNTTEQILPRFHELMEALA